MHSDGWKARQIFVAMGTRLLTGKQASSFVRPLLSRTRFAYTALRLPKLPGKPVRAGLPEMSSPLVTPVNAYMQSLQSI